MKGKFGLESAEQEDRGVPRWTVHGESASRTQLGWSTRKNVCVVHIHTL